MDLRRIVVIVRRRLLLLVVMAIVGLVAAYLGSSRASIYQAQTTVLVGATPSSVDPSTEYGQALLATSLAQIVPSPTVVADAIAATKVSRKQTEVASSTTATVLPGSNLIKITVSDRDPVVAESLANGLAHVFVSGALQLLPVVGGSADSPPARVAEAATLPSSPLATNLRRNMVLGGLAGLLIGVAVVLLVDFLGLAARTPGQLEAELDLPVIGIVPFQPRLAQAGFGPQGGRVMLLMDDEA